MYALLVRDMTGEQRAELDAWLADPTAVSETGEGSVWETAGDIVRVG